MCLSPTEGTFSYISTCINLLLALFTIVCKLAGLHVYLCGRSVCRHPILEQLAEHCSISVEHLWHPCGDVHILSGASWPLGAWLSGEAYLGVPRDRTDLIRASGAFFVKSQELTVDIRKVSHGTCSQCCSLCFGQHVIALLERLLPCRVSMGALLNDCFGAPNVCYRFWSIKAGHTLEHFADGVLCCLLSTLVAGREAG